jgi:hypothetical protein
MRMSVGTMVVRARSAAGLGLCVGCFAVFGLLLGLIVALIAWIDRATPLEALLNVPIVIASLAVEGLVVGLLGVRRRPLVRGKLSMYALVFALGGGAISAHLLVEPHVRATDFWLTTLAACAGGGLAGAASLRLIGILDLDEWLDD